MNGLRRYSTQPRAMAVARAVSSAVPLMKMTGSFAATMWGWQTSSKPDILPSWRSTTAQPASQLAMQPRKSSALANVWTGKPAIFSMRSSARRIPGSAPLAWEVYTHGGRRPTGLDAIAWCEKMAAYGAGEILLTSMDRDGTRDGFDLELTRAVADRLPIPVIASGGVGNLEHLYQGIADGHAEAVLAASIFHFGEATVGQAHDYLRARGVPVRNRATEEQHVDAR